MSNVRRQVKAATKMLRTSELISSVAWAVVPPLIVTAILLVYYGFPEENLNHSLGWLLAVAYGSYIVWAWGTQRNIQLAATTIPANGALGIRLLALVVGAVHICAGVYMLIR